MSWDKVILVLRLTVVLTFAAIDGIGLSFNVYAVVLKETFNFTQTQVEITASMSSLGIGLSFLEPVLTEVFGHTVTFVVTWLAFPTSCLLLVLAAVYRHVFCQWPVLVYVSQLCMTVSSSMAYMAVTGTFLETVPKRLTGTFMGAFGTAVCFGKIFYAGLYDWFFQDDMVGFFSCLSALAAIVLGVCYIMIYPIAMTLENKPDATNADTENSETSDMKIEPEILRSRFFHMTFWSVTIFAAVTTSILNNITSVTDSLGVRDPFYTVTIMSICMMTTRLLFGLIFDKCPSMSCGFILLFTGYSSVTVGLCVGMYYLNTRTMYFVTFLYGIGCGSDMYLPLVLLVTKFGRNSFRFIFSSFFAFSAITIPIFQIIMGFLYDGQIARNGSGLNMCYGTECFFSSFALLLCVTTLVMSVQAVNFVMTLYCSRRS